MNPIESYHDLVRRDVFGLVPAEAGRVLDFGGGVGATSATLKAEGRASNAVLFDQMADNPVDGIDAAEALDLNDLAKIGAALDRTGPFDTILCLDILEHLQEPWDIVKLLDGALAPGGSLIVSVPNINHIGVLGGLIFGGRFDYTEAGVMDRTHIRWFTRSSAIGLATASGMSVEAVEPNISRRAHKIPNALTLGLFERFFAVQYKVRVRKA